MRVHTQSRPDEAHATGTERKPPPQSSAPPDPIRASAASPADTRSGVLAAVNAGAGNAALSRWLARQPAPPPTTGLSEADDARLNEEVDFHRAASRYESAQAELTVVLDDEEEDFWFRVLDEPTFRAFHFRCALILEATPLSSTAELDALLETVEAKAGDEAQTLGIAGNHLLDDEAWAFPKSWSARVASTLRPPSDLDPAEAAAQEQAAVAKLLEIADGIPRYVRAHGLPVPFAQALTLRGFPFHAAHATLPSGHAVKDYAIQAKDVGAAKIRNGLAQGWQRGKRALVEAVAEGDKVLNPAAWAKAASRRTYQPDLASMIDTANHENVDSVYEAMISEGIDLYRHELALAKLVGFTRPFRAANAAAFVSTTFGSAMQGADALIAKASEDERMDMADAWATEHGYPAAARKLMLDALADNADEIALDIITDIGISAIPVVGWLWAAKEIVGEVADVVEAGGELVDARSKVQGAKTVVALQRAAAELSLTEYTSGLTLVMAIAGNVKGGKADAQASAKPAGGRHGTPPAPPHAPAPPSKTPSPPAGRDPWSDTPASNPSPAPATSPDAPSAAKPDAPSGAKPDASPAAKPDAPQAPRPDTPPTSRETVTSELLEAGDQLGVQLDGKMLRDLARDNPKQFDAIVEQVRDELVERAGRHGGKKGAQTAKAFEDAGKLGKGGGRPPPETVGVPAQKSTVKTSHDAGTEGGRAEAAKDGIAITDWDNPEGHIGDYGHGFDDVGSKGAERFILEYKGESSKLSRDQLSSAWVGRVLARLKHVNDPVADELLKAALDGKLKGHLYRTTIGDKGRLSTAREGDPITFDGAAVREAYEKRLAELAKPKKKKPPKPKKPGKKPGKPKDDDE